MRLNINSCLLHLSWHLEWSFYAKNTLHCITNVTNKIGLNSLCFSTRVLRKIFQDALHNLKTFTKVCKNSNIFFQFVLFFKFRFFFKIMCRKFKKGLRTTALSIDIQGTLYLFCTALSSHFARTGKQNALWSLQQPTWKRCPNRNIFLLWTKFLFISCRSCLMWSLLTGPKVITIIGYFYIVSISQWDFQLWSH